MQNITLIHKSQNEIISTFACNSEYIIEFLITSHNASEVFLYTT